MHGNFVIETDALGCCICVLLQQDQGQGLQPIAYYSKKLKGAPNNFTTHERELMVIKVVVKKGHPYMNWQMPDHCH